MRILKQRALVTAVCALFVASCATAPDDKLAPPSIQWQSVAKTDTQEAFIDIASIVAAGAYLDASVKYEFAAPQPWEGDKTYSSVASLVRADCAGQRMADRETKTYAAPGLQGDVVRKASRSEKNLIWYAATRPTVVGEVLAAICRRAPAAP